MSAAGRLSHRLAAPLLGLGVFAYQLAYPRVLGRVDESVVLYGAKRILQGQALYRDFFEFITPGSFYLFAGVFALTGPSLLAARLVMTLANSASAVLLFLVIVRYGASPAEAVAASVVFAVVCLPVWRIASPHWLSTTLCLATAAVLLPAYTRGLGRGRAAAVGALAGLVFCVQQHRGVALGAWVALGLIVVRRQRRHDASQDAWSALMSMAVGWLSVTGAILGYAMWRASAGELVYATFSFVFQNYFAAAVPMPWAGVCPICGETLPYTWHWLLRGLPALFAIETFVAVWRLRTQPDDGEWIRLVLCLLALCMGISILYYPDFIHVAFVAPFGLIVAASLVHRLLRSEIWRRSPVLAPAPAIALVALLIAVGVQAQRNLALAWRSAPEKFDSAMGWLRGSAADRDLLQGVRQLMSGAAPHERTLLSYPPEPWLFLAVPADNPMPFSLLHPGYNSPEQFGAAVAALEQRPPNYLVVTVPGFRREDPVLRGQLERFREVRRIGVYRLAVRAEDHAVR